jgi:hypothetical protein
MSITILQRDNKPEEWRRLMGRVAEAQKAGLPMMGQVLTRPTGIMLGFEISQNPFVGRPSWKEIEALPFPEKMKRLVQRTSARLISERSRMSVSRRVTKWDRIFPLGDPPDYEPPAREASLQWPRVKGGSPPRLPTTCCLRRAARRSSTGR